MRIRKNHRQKKYRYNVNRRLLKKKNTTGKVKDIALKCLWQKDQLPRKTFATVGVSLNPNKSLPIPNYRQERANLAKYVVTNEEKAMESKLLQSKKPNPMVEHLEELAKQRAESKFRLPKEVVKHLSYFLDKYKLNYRDMTLDRQNRDQWTWKKFRMQIRRFRSIPEQFNKYLEQRNLPIDAELNWPEYNSDSEWS